MGFGPGEVDGVDDESDIGGVFAGLGAFWDFDEFDGGFVEGCGVGGIAGPIGVGFFDDEFSFFDEAFEDFLDVEFRSARALEPHGEVFEVDEDGEVSVAFGECHGGIGCCGGWV